MKRFLLLSLQVVGALTLLVALVGGGLVLSAGYWLRMDDALKKADAIVILAGDVRRAIHAADLYQQGFAPSIYVSSPKHDPPQALCDLGFDCPRQEDQMRKVIAAKGVPPEKLRVYGHEVMSTVEEGEHMMRELGLEPKRIIVVTSSYHCRRAKMILSSVLGGHEIIMSPTPYERFDRIWWEHQGSAGAVVSEVTKFVFYFLGKPFRTNPAIAR